MQRREPPSLNAEIASAHIQRAAPSLALLRLQQIGDRVPIPRYRGDVVRQRAAGDAAQMAAPVVIGEGQVGDAVVSNPVALLGSERKTQRLVVLR